MRWRIESKVSEKGDQKITKITETQYITIGDIVGKGKSAAGAVKALAENLPKAIYNNTINASNKFVDKNKPTLEFVNGIVQPLAVIIEGMETFRSMAGIIDIMTPIMKTIARSTGVWCSPGNVSDLIQIGLGTAQQILISIITSAILNLKELIWNYEITINEMTTELSERIVNLLKKYNDQHKDDKPSSNPIEEIENEKNSNNEDGLKPDYDFEKDDPVEKEIDNLIDKVFSPDNENVGLELNDVLDFIETNHSNKRKNDLEKTSDYITKFTINKTLRMLRGSLSNKGIYYSDDDGKTWNQTKQLNHSFNCFAKIPMGNSYRYLAGSTHTVDEIVLTKDAKFEKDIFECYSKDYYNDKKIKYPKYKKDSIEKEGFEKNKINLYDRKVDDAVGIYYSDDNGITWTPSDINSGSFERFHEFESKYGYDDSIIPFRVVASSYDYKGVRYSEDGITWNNAISNITKEDIVTGRWVFYNSFDNELISFFNIDNMDTYYNKQNIKINSLEDSSLEKIDMNIKMDYKVIQGFEKIKPENTELINNIIVYLHENFSDKIPQLSHERWYNIIIAINDGSYTMENAKLGERLEPDWDPEKDEPIL